MIRGKCNKLRRNYSGGLGLVLCFGLLCYGGLAQAATLNVPSASYPTIQSAIDAASGGDIVLVDNGTYVENINFNGRAITVRSENGAASTIIDGNASGSVVTFNSGEGSGSVLDGFTITNGVATNGGGIYCSASSSPTITNCTISNNTATSGGGGISASSSSSPTVTNCTINGNTANYGGGVYCSSYSVITITNCTVSGNSASYGGGVFGSWSYSETIITNCTITGNFASSYAGGLNSSNGASMTITNSTISGNKAGTCGGGIYYYDEPTTVNSIVWGNSPQSMCTSNSVYVSYNTTYSDIDRNEPGVGNINADPLFVNPRPASEAPTSTGDYHLQSSSPCIDVGTGTGAPAEDIDGDARPQGDGYDMGADEYLDISACNNISLTNGWNLMSLPSQPTNTVIGSVLSSISGKYASVWAFKNSTWEVFDPASPGFSDLTSMKAGWGYWIKMNEAADLGISGTTPSKSIELVNGWNLVGYNSCIPQPIADALASIEGKYVSVWAFMDGGWKVYDPASPGFSDLLTMEPNYGYWINTTQVCTWTLP